MIKICVTGNKGFIGKALQTELERMGYVVIGLEKWVFERERWQQQLHEYLANLNPDVVFHVGACSDTQNQNVSEMMKMNTESTFIISDYCQFKDIPLIYSSSASVYGNKNEPETLYAWSKYLGEQFVSKCGGVSLRYFNVYGNYEIPKGKMASVACQAYIKHRNGEKVTLFPNKPTRDFIYINDVVSANIYAWQNYNEVKGGWYHVGSGESRSFEDVLNIMGIPFEYTDASQIPENYQHFTCAYTSNFMKDWQPKYNLEAGLEDYKALLSLSTLNNI